MAVTSPRDEEPEVRSFDVAIIGMGPGGEATAGRLLHAGRSVAVVERELIGGECAYWACIPSKTLLRAPEAQHEAARTAGVSRPDLNWTELREYRDYMVRHFDDAKQIRDYESSGATVLKGVARLTDPGRLEVDGEPLQADHIVIATGSTPLRPPVEGLDSVRVWTNREATSLGDIPSRVVLIGGSAVGVELGQFFARMGARTSIVQRASRLLDREDPRVGQLAQQMLESEDVDIRTGHQVARARPVGDAAVVTLDDGSEIEADVVVLAAGRRPNTDGLNVSAAGVVLDERGAIPVDDRCRAGERLWACGDVTGVALFTHVATYQGRVIADNILGRDRRASYRGVPRVVFADPEIAAVGLTADQARVDGIDVAEMEVDLVEHLARPWTYEREPRGALGLLVDRGRRVVVGAWAVAPLAGEWIHQAALAIRAEIPLDVLADSIAQFPTYSEALPNAVDHLSL